MHHVKNDDDSLGMKFPLNSYETSDPEKVLDCIRGLLFNELSGINRVVILNGRLKEPIQGGLLKLRRGDVIIHAKVVAIEGHVPSEERPTFWGESLTGH
jgi:hypothetical protein